MRLKLVIAVAATLITLGLVVYERPRLNSPVPLSVQSSSLSTKHAVAPRVPAPRLAMSSSPVDPSPDSPSHTNLIAATQPIQDYSLEFVQNGEEAYRAAGYSDAEARMIATSTLLLPQLAEIKQVGRNLVDLAEAYRQSGDGASAQAALQMGISLGQWLDEPGSLTIIQSLVGIALQRIVFNAMDPNSPYGDTGQTVRNQIDALAQRREAIRALAQQVETVLPTMSDQDLISYFDRMKVFGEQAAIRWAASRHNPP